MRKGLIFFCCSCAILLFTIINLSVGPIISGKVGHDTNSNAFSNTPPDEYYWGTANCEYYKDKYDEAKSTALDDILKYTWGWYKDECIRKKAMHDNYIEYQNKYIQIGLPFFQRKHHHYLF